MTLLPPAPDLLAGPLSAAMRDGSRQQHEDAEGSAFMTALLEGRVDEAGYAGYLARLRLVYAAMESAGRAQLDDAAVAAVVDPALERLEAIEDDLDLWTGGAGLEVESPAATAYVERLRAASGLRFVAHHYTRYLGDLSGGQAIGRLLGREFGLERGGRGLRFYDFPAIPKPKPYKDAYRARLDALPLTSHDKATVVEEVQVAFGLNQALFAELSTTLAEHTRTPCG